MKSIIEPRFCLNCNDPLKGRSDKKFCDDQCRNAYNNEMKSIHHKELSAINKVLSRNRKILKGFLGENGTKATAKREEMLMKGFHFNYITHSVTNQKGQTILCCYDLGYYQDKEDKYIILSV